MDERRQLLFALCASLLLSYCVSVQGYGFSYDPSTDPTHSCYKENGTYVNFDPEQEPFKCLSPYPGMRDEVPSGFEDLETEYVEIKSLNVDASKSTNENKTENEPSLADQIATGRFKVSEHCGWKQKCKIFADTSWRDHRVMDERPFTPHVFNINPQHEDTCETSKFKENDDGRWCDVYEFENGSVKWKHGSTCCSDSLDDCCKFSGKKIGIFATIIFAGSVIILTFYFNVRHCYLLRKHSKLSLTRILCCCWYSKVETENKMTDPDTGELFKKSDYVCGFTCWNLIKLLFCMSFLIIFAVLLYLYMMIMALSSFGA